MHAETPLGESMNRGSDFLYEQDRLRRNAQYRHAEELDSNARDRQRNYFQMADERDKRIQDNLAERDWARRNDDHKKSIFQSELHNARLEHRPPIYNSFLEVPDLARPRPTFKFNFLGFGLVGLCIVGIILYLISLVLGLVVYVAVNIIGTILYWLFIALVVGYAVSTAVWAFRRFVRRPETPDAIARAEAWNPIALTKKAVGYAYGYLGRRSAARRPQESGPEQEPQLDPSNLDHTDARVPEADASQPRNFDPDTGQSDAPPLRI